MWNNKAWELGNSATTEGKYVSKLMTSQPERFLSCLHNYVNAHMWHCMIQRITMVLVIYLLHWFEFRACDWVCTWAHDYHPLEFHSLGLSKATWVITFGFVYHYTNLLAIYGYMLRRVLNISDLFTQSSQIICSSGGLNFIIQHATNIKVTSPHEQSKKCLL